MFSDKAMYSHLIAQQDAAQGYLPTGHGVYLILFYFSSTAKMKLRKWCSVSALGMHIFRQKEPFNCVSFKTATGKKRVIDLALLPLLL